MSVTLHTNLGDIKCEIACDEVPKASEKKVPDPAISVMEDILQENRRLDTLNNEKDNVIKNYEKNVASLNSKVRQLQVELTTKEDRLCDVEADLDKANYEIERLETFVKMVSVELTDLDEQNVAFSDKFVKVNTLLTSYFELLHKEKELATEKAHLRFDSLGGQFASETEALQLVNQQLNNKITELRHENIEVVMLEGIDELQGLLNKKEQLILEFKEREKLLEHRNTEGVYTTTFVSETLNQIKELVVLGFCHIINIGTREELESLEWIGPRKAESIMSARLEPSKLCCFDDIMGMGLTAGHVNNIIMKNMAKLFKT